MFAPPSWGLARQEHARSPPIGHRKWKFMPTFSWKKSAKRSSERSQQQQNDLSSTSTSVLLDISKNRSCVDLSVNAQPDGCIRIARTLSNSSDADSDNSNSEFIEKMASDSDSEQETDHPTASSSAPSTSSAPEQGQFAVPNTTPRIPVSAIYKQRTHDLPAPTEAQLCVYRRTKTLEFDKRGEPYFKISKGAINISSLPPQEQNAAYNDVLTKAVPTNALESGSASVPRFCTGRILEQYSLHLTRLAFTRSSIRDLALQHRQSAARSYTYTTKPWRSGTLRDTQKKAATAFHTTASSAFKMRVARERDERGIMQLLDRCERILELDPDFESVPWRARSPSLPRKRWKEGGRGWSGLDPDDLVSRIARRTDAERSEDRAKAKAVLKKAFSRAANREMGKTRRQSSVFSRTATPDSKTVA